MKKTLEAHKEFEYRFIEVLQTEPWLLITCKCKTWTGSWNNVIRLSMNVYKQCEIYQKQEKNILNSGWKTTRYCRNVEIFGGREWEVFFIHSHSLKLMTKENSETTNENYLGCKFFGASIGSLYLFVQFLD